MLLRCVARAPAASRPGGIKPSTRPRCVDPGASCAIVFGPVLPERGTGGSADPEEAVAGRGHREGKAASEGPVARAAGAAKGTRLRDTVGLLGLARLGPPDGVTLSCSSPGSTNTTAGLGGHEARGLGRSRSAGRSSGRMRGRPRVGGRVGGRTLLQGVAEDPVGAMSRLVRRSRGAAEVWGLAAAVAGAVYRRRAAWGGTGAMPQLGVAKGERGNRARGRATWGNAKATSVP